MRNKAQVSVEFIMIIGVVTLAFIVAIALIFDFIGNTVKMKENTALSDLGETISREVIIAKSVGDFYQKEFTLPASVEGVAYNISINSFNPPKTNYSEIILTFQDPNSELIYEKIVFLYNVDVASIGKGINIIKKKRNFISVCNTQAPEICDARDNDCDDLIDEGCDTNQDGYIDSSMICDVDAEEDILCADDDGVVDVSVDCQSNCWDLDFNDNI